jgi:hypothetical protein
VGEGWSWSLWCRTGVVLMSAFAAEKAHNGKRSGKSVRWESFHQANNRRTTNRIFRSEEGARLLLAVRRDL